MDGREIMLEVDIVLKDSEKDDLKCVLVGTNLITYVKTCHEMSCYKNGAVLILNWNKDNEIRIVTDVYKDRQGNMWVKARFINQDYELNKTRFLNGMDEVIKANKEDK